MPLSSANHFRLFLRFFVPSVISYEDGGDPHYVEERGFNLFDANFFTPATEGAAPPLRVWILRTVRGDGLKLLNSSAHKVSVTSFTDPDGLGSRVTVLRANQSMRLRCAPHCCYSIRVNDEYDFGLTFAARSFSSLAEYQRALE